MHVAVVILPAAVVGHLDGLLVRTGFVHTGADVLKQVLVVASAELRDDVLRGQRLDGLVLGHDGLLREHDLLWAFLAIVDHMHGVLVVGLEQAHNKQVKGQQHDLLGCGLTVSVLVASLHVHAACAAVAKATWSAGSSHCRGGGSFAVLGFVVGVQFLINAGLVVVFGLHLTGCQADFFLGGVELNDTAKPQGVGDLAKVRAAGADAGVLAVHLQAGVWAFDLLPLLLHALGLVGVQVRQALRILQAVILTALGP